MPPLSPDDKIKTRAESADPASTYPIEAYEFIQSGLKFTAGKLHGNAVGPARPAHVSGRQLCMGLREYALNRWGLMAGLVLQRWNINRTLDFGRIVFNLVEAGRLGVTEEDSIDDFRDVYDFGHLESSYKIQSKI
jgi:uncharacterized repeat protein (TIGR04138 family)